MALSRIYKSGKQLKPVRPKQPTKAEFAKGFAHQLNCALIKRKEEMTELDRMGLIPSTLQEDIEIFFMRACKIADLTIQINERITRRLMTSIGQMASTLKDFQASLEKNIDLHCADDLLLLRTLKDLYDDVAHFVQQITITHHSISAVRSSNNLPNRPTDWSRKKVFLAEVSTYQEKNNSKKYPRYKLIAKAMELAGLNLPERTYGDWKKQHCLGTFVYLVQKR